MKQKIIPILVCLMALALLGIVYIQYLWVQNTIAEKQKLIDIQVYHIIANIEEQLNNHKGIQIIKDSIIDNSSMISSIIEDEYDFVPNFDTASKIELKILSNLKSNSDTGNQIIIHQNFQSYKLKEIQKDEISRVLNVIEKIGLEELNPIHDIRLDSAKINNLLQKELNYIFPNKKFDWGIYDTAQQLYTITPTDSIEMDYIAPLFSTDIIAPNRYEMHLKINRNQLIWDTIGSTILLSFLFLFIIISVFYWSVKLLIKHKKISQIKSDFINNMTHEFKTPLASISLAADSLIHPNADLSKKYLEQYVHIIQQEKKKLNTHIERILEVAALNHNALNIPLKKVDITPIIASAIQNLNLLIEKNGVTVRYTAKQSKWGIAHPIHLENVLVNLIENGIKYRSQQPIIDINIEHKSHFIEIKVSDNGIGMNKQQLNRVFEDFYRVQTGDLHNSKGFGLGLTYCKLVIEKMGGNIQLESQPQQGTVATLFIKSASYTS